MSIASEITRLQGVKSDILQAIADKGVTVPAGSALDDCPGLIGDISIGLPFDGYVTIDGDDYPYRVINNRKWTVTNYRNSNIPHYGADPSIWPPIKYGYAYKSSIMSQINLPTGWRIPSKNDFIDLVYALKFEDYVENIRKFELLYSPITPDDGVTFDTAGFNMWVSSSGSIYGGYNNGGGDIKKSSDDYNVNGALYYNVPGSYLSQYAFALRFCSDID